MEAKGDYNVKNDFAINTQMTLFVQLLCFIIKFPYTSSRSVDALEEAKSDVNTKK